MTRIFQGDDTSGMRNCAHIIQRGGLVAFPTETVYGLGANALDESAVRKIFAAKGRPSDNPLIVHIADLVQVEECAGDIPPLAKKAIDAFWPGPFTIVVKKDEYLPANVTANLKTVALRMPNNPIALKLIKESGVPIAAPSANTSGKPSPTCAQHVLEDMEGKVEAIIDGGSCTHGVESTVVDFTQSPPMLLRPGNVTLEQLNEVLGEVAVHPNVHAQETSDSEAPQSPGMKYTHYSPKAKVILLVGSEDAVEKKIDEIATPHSGIIRAHDKTEFAQKLFATFRECDAQNCDMIIVEAMNEEHLGLAIMNRLRKAANEIIELD